MQTGQSNSDSGVTVSIADDGAGNKYLKLPTLDNDAGEGWQNAQIKLTNELWVKILLISMVGPGNYFQNLTFVCHAKNATGDRKFYWNA